jgi:hypothetical protein
MCSRLVLEQLKTYEINDQSDTLLDLNTPTLLGVPILDHLLDILLDVYLQYYTT